MASRRFREDVGAWLPAPATPVPGGHRVHLSVAARPVPEVAAVVAVGPLVRPAPGLVLRSVSWQAETADDLFPVLRAELELHTTGRSRLRLVGSYTPPLSVLGAVTDKFVGRHVARDVVNGFVAGVARRLVEPAGAGHVPGAGVP